MTKISSIHTPCKKCVFSEYDNITQTGCAIGYIEIFKNKGYEILDAYDDDNEFYIINNKKCIGYREDKWFDQFELPDSSLQTKIAKFNELNHINYSIIINLKNLQYNDFENICDTIKKCSFQPQKIIIIRYVGDDQVFAYSSIETTLKDKELTSKWRIQTILDTELSFNEIINNAVVHTVDSRFVIALSSAQNNLTELVDKANDIVYKNFEQFMVMGNSEKTCFIFSAAVFKYGKMLGKQILLDDNEYTVV